MRKTKLLVVLLIVSVIALVGVFMACDVNKDLPSVTANVVEKDFFDCAKSVKESELNIVVTQAEDKIYELDTVNGIDRGVEGVEFNRASFSGQVSGLSYSSSDFKDSNISKQEALSTYTYVATIANPSDYLQISEGTVTNATINIVVSTNKELYNIQIAYTHTVLDIEYNVQITITAKD